MNLNIQHITTLMDTLTIYNTIEVNYDYIYNILNEFSYGLDKKWINLETITNDILKYVKREMTENEIYTFISDYCAQKASFHPDYNKLASNISVKRLHKATFDDIRDVWKILYFNVDKHGVHCPIISDDLHRIISEYGDKIQSKLDMSRDYLLDYFGLKTLERSYLYRVYYLKTKTKNNGVIVERPQHMWMRVAIGIHGYDLDSAFETYDLMSQKYFTHATPTLFNSGSRRQQNSSCFLIGMEDNIEGIFKTISNIAHISKWAGGIGVHLSAIRGKGSLIRGTQGTSDGIIPLCLLLNREGKYINQGGKRNGSIACYLEPWHCDIFEFCELRKNTKDEDSKARDLFLALWVSDIFMRRVEENGVWSLMCPDECPHLVSTHGEEFERLYIKYETDGRFKRQVKARDLWYHILDCQIETGMPYMLYKDHANKKSNQQNLGTIRSSNLCAEIIEYSNGTNETAVCNLGSICLPMFIDTDKDGNKTYNYEKLLYVSKVLTKNLNKIIDNNFYPIEEAKYSNLKHRPIGVGVQGTADVYNILGLPFGSEKAREINKKIFETIYYGTLVASNELAKTDGAYETFHGSPFSKGLLQYHLWGLTEKDLLMGYDWNGLVDNIKKYGTRNSLLTALMPTASTSQIMKNVESFEPYMSNVFVRSTLAGDFIVINENLINDLIKLNIWSDDVRKKIIIFNGSIKDIPEIPEHIKNVYKTAFEISLKDIITQSIERGPFVDQSQSMNLFMDKSNFDKLSSAHFYGWKNGIKTGMYYLRTRPAVDPIQFGIDIEEINRLSGKSSDGVCTFRPGVKLSECDVCSG